MELMRPVNLTADNERGLAKVLYLIRLKGRVAGSSEHARVWMQRAIKCTRVAPFDRCTCGVTHFVSEGAQTNDAVYTKDAGAEEEQTSTEDCDRLSFLNAVKSIRAVSALLQKPKRGKRPMRSKGGETATR